MVWMENSFPITMLTIAPLVNLLSNSQRISSVSREQVVQQLWQHCPLPLVHGAEEGH